MNNHLIQQTQQREQARVSRWQSKGPGKLLGSPLLAAFLLVAVCCGAMVVWSSGIEMGGNVSATGKVGSRGSHLTLNHQTGGVIAELLVQNGDAVEPGQSLLVLQSPQNRAASDVLLIRKSLFEATIARLTAEQDWEDALVYPHELLELRAVSGEVQEVLDAQQELFARNLESYQSRQAAAARVLAQNEESVAELERQLKAQATQLVLMENDLAGKKVQLDRGQYPRADYLALQSVKSEIENEMSEKERLIDRARRNISDAQAEITSIDSDRMEQISSDLASARVDLTAIEQQILVREESIENTVVRAPAAGVVADLRFDSTGGMIEAEAPILDLLPDENAPLMIAASISAVDINSVYEDQLASIVITDSDGNTLPDLAGRILSVSAEPVINQESGQSFYQAEIAVARRELETLEMQTSITEGLPVQVFIETGDTTMLGYLLQPFSDSFRRHISAL